MQGSYSASRHQTKTSGAHSGCPRRTGVTRNSLIYSLINFMIGFKPQLYIIYYLEQEIRLKTQNMWAPNHMTCHPLYSALRSGRKVHRIMLKPARDALPRGPHPTASVW